LLCKWHQAEPAAPNNSARGAIGVCQHVNRNFEIADRAIKMKEQRKTKKQKKKGEQIKEKCVFSCSICNGFWIF